MKTRRVQPEILDSLAANDPDAVHSRRDLRWINWLMGNHQWLRRQWCKRAPLEASLLELGAGDGGFGLGLIRAGLLRPERLHAIDLGPPPADWPGEATWHQRDVFDGYLPASDVIVANLFLHHFEDNSLKRLGKAMCEHAGLWLFSEPQRHPAHLWQGWLLHWVIRLNRVTQHDLRVSVEAGFRGDELARVLEIHADPRWRSTSSSSVLGAHRLIAEVSLPSSDRRHRRTAT